MIVGHNPPPPMVAERQKKNRSRPNLSRVCQKTKLCSFHLNGNCERAEACSFAHDPSELQPKPDLQCTKLCPHLLKKGHCAKRSSCKFAHNDFEVQAIGVENMAPSLTDPQIFTGHQLFLSPPRLSLEQAVPGNFASSFDLMDSSFLATPEITPRIDDSYVTSHLGFAAEAGTAAESGSFLATPEHSPRTTNPLIASHLGNAAESGALLLQDMVLHLEHIFRSMYQAQPDVAERIGMPASLLASATAEQAWVDAGMNRDARMSFTELIRWCAIPMGQVSAPSAPSQKVKLQEDHGSHGADSDAWSISTDEGQSHSDLSEGTVGWQSPAAWSINSESSKRETPLRRSLSLASCTAWSVSTDEGHSSSDMSEGITSYPTPNSNDTLHGFSEDVKITVRNTFFDFELVCAAATARRSRSLPAPLRNRNF